MAVKAFNTPGAGAGGDGGDGNNNGRRSRLIPQRFIDHEHSYTSLTEIIGHVVLNPRPPLAWFAVTFVAFILLNVFLMSVTWLIMEGIGIWGNNIPVGWAWDIVNFVWWIGIGHAGT